VWNSTGLRSGGEEVNAEMLDVEDKENDPNNGGIGRKKGGLQ
jgi:hypothetical protein